MTTSLTCLYGVVIGYADSYTYSVKLRPAKWVLSKRGQALVIECLGTEAGIENGSLHAEHTAIPSFDSIIHKLMNFCGAQDDGPLQTLPLRLTGAGAAQLVQRQGYGPDDWGSIPDRGNDRTFCLRHRVWTGSGAHTASYPMGTGGSYRGVKRLGHEGDHSPPPTTEARNAWRYTSKSPKCLHGVGLIK
jgi:hypothetical protein